MRRAVFNAGIAQLVEHNLAKVGVAGSNPVSRSIKKDGEEWIAGSLAGLSRNLLFLPVVTIYFSLLTF